MEKLEKFINENACEFSKFLPDEDLLKAAEKSLNIKFGVQLRKYLLNYGYLGYKYVELFGMNNHQGVNSDMIIKTLRINKLFKKTKGLIIIENQGDGDYYLVNSSDYIYRFMLSRNELIPQNIYLFDYILQRFSSINENK